MSWWSVPEEYPGLFAGLANFGNQFHWNSPSSRLPDCISWRSLSGAQVNSAVLVIRLRNVPDPCRRLDQAGGRLPQHGVLSRTVLAFFVKVPVLRGSAVCHPPRSPDPVKTTKFLSRSRIPPRPVKSPGSSQAVPFVDPQPVGGVSSATKSGSCEDDQVPVKVPDSAKQ